MKDIPEYDGLYAITENGEVWSHRNKSFLVLKTSKSGYKECALHKCGKVKWFLVHRLVALAFIDNPNGLPCVNHKDENKGNNTVSNLEWCTYKYNSNYGTAKYRSAIAKSLPVLCVETNEVFKSVADASNWCGSYTTNISKCCSGKRHTAGGYHWRYCL